MSATPEDMVALHAFCGAERELMRITKESKGQVHDATVKRDECMTELLACMEDKNVECVAVSGAGLDTKYARITQSHTTRGLTPKLVTHALVHRHDDIVSLCQSKLELTSDELINCIYEVVKDERNTYKPIVTFSNHLPRGMDAAGIMDVTGDEQLQHVVLATKESQAEHARLLQTVRAQKQALEEQRDGHVEHVQAYLEKQNMNKQCLLDGTGNLFYIRKRSVKHSTPLTVAQFKVILSTALEQLREARCAATGLPPPEELAEVVTELMSKTRTMYNKDVVKLSFNTGRKRRRGDEGEENDDDGDNDGDSDE